MYSCCALLWLVQQFGTCWATTAQSRPQHHQLWLPAENKALLAVFSALSALEALCENA